MKRAMIRMQKSVTEDQAANTKVLSSPLKSISSLSMRSS